MGDGYTLLNALVGAVVNLLVASVVPFAPVAGGEVAGYLEGGSRGDGLGVGAMVGAIATLSVVSFFYLFGGLLDVAVQVPVMVAGIPGTVFLLIPGGGVLTLAFLLFVVPLIIVGLGAAGGWLGNYVKYDADVGS